MTPALVVFDLDGTLLDTHADLIDSLNHTIASIGLAPVSYDDLTHLVGHGAKVMIERACKLHGHPLTEDESGPLLQRFIAHYSSTMPGHTKPYPGLIAAMDNLKANGFTLAVCTNKLESLARTLIDALGLTHYFAAITGGDTFPVRKPDARHLLGTIEKAGGTPERSIVAICRVKNVMSRSVTLRPPRNVWRLILVMRTPCRRRLVVTTVSEAARISPRTCRLLRSIPSHRYVYSLTSLRAVAVAVAMV